MKQAVKTLFLASFCIVYNHASLPKEEALKDEKKQVALKNNIKSELIVTFEKGTSVQEAISIIEANSMSVVKVYKHISKSKNKPMLHIRSSMCIQKMRKIIKSIPNISAVSENNRRRML